MLRSKAAARSSYSLAWVGVLALLPVGSGYVLTTDGATCAAGAEITSSADCTVAIAAANTAIGKPGYGSVSQESNGGYPKGCYSNTKTLSHGYYHGYFNTHATGSGTGTALSGDRYVHCHPGTFATKGTLQTAVQLWINDQTAALSTYGHISGWGVSAITNMARLFPGLATFNEDISNWDTSSVTSMSEMFRVRPPRVPCPQCPIGSEVLPACTVTASTRPRASRSVRRPP